MLGLSQAATWERNTHEVIEELRGAARDRGTRMEREKYEEAFSSDVGIQEFYKLFKYVSCKSAKVLLPGVKQLSNRIWIYLNILESARIFLRLSDLRTHL